MHDKHPFDEVIRRICPYSACPDFPWRIARLALEAAGTLPELADSADLLLGQQRLEVYDWRVNAPFPGSVARGVQAALPAQWRAVALERTSTACDVLSPSGHSFFLSVGVRGDILIIDRHGVTRSSYAGNPSTRVRIAIQHLIEMDRALDGSPVVPVWRASVYSASWDANGSPC